MSYAYSILTQEQVNLLDNYSPWASEVKLSELLDNALSIAAGEVPDNSITTSKLVNASVTLAKLATGIAPASIVVASGTHTTVGGSASESVTVSGVLITDIVQVTMKTLGAAPQTVLTAAAGAGAVNLVFSADPSNDHVVCYTVFRVAS